MIFTVNCLTSPHSAAISIIPIQKATTPAMVMAKEIPSPALSKTASVIHSMFPVNVPYMIPIRIIPAHKKFNIFFYPDSFIASYDVRRTDMFILSQKEKGCRVLQQPLIII